MKSIKNFIASLMIIGSANICAMHNAPEMMDEEKNPQITITLPDGTEYGLDNWLSKSEVLDIKKLGIKMGAITLSVIDPDVLNAIVACPEDRNDAAKYIASLDIEVLSKLIEACDYLEIAELFTICTQEYAERCTTGEQLEKFNDDPDGYLEDWAGFTEEINYAIGQAIIQKRDICKANYRPSYSTDSLGKGFKWTKDFIDGQDFVFSRHGTFLASALTTGGANLWHIKDGKPFYIREITPNDRDTQIMSAAFSPDETMVAVGDCRKVRLWDVKKRQSRGTFIGHAHWIYSLCFSPCGNIVASGSGGNDNTVKLWNINNGQCVRTLIGYEKHIKGICFSPDGTMLAARSFDGVAKLWNIESGVCLETFEKVYAMSFSPYENIIVFGLGNGNVELRSLVDDTPTRKLGTHKCYVTSIVFSPDGKMMASQSANGTIKVWDMKNYKCVAALNYKAHGIHFSSDGKKLLIADGRDSVVWSWNVEKYSLCLEQAVLLALMKHGIEEDIHYSFCDTQRLEEIYRSLPWNMLLSPQNMF